MMIILSIAVFLASGYVGLFINSFNHGDEFLMAAIFGLLGVAILWLVKISRDLEAFKKAVNLKIDEHNANEKSKSEFDDSE